MLLLRAPCTGSSSVPARPPLRPSAWPGATAGEAGKGSSDVHRVWVKVIRVCLYLWGERELSQWHIRERVLPSLGYANQERDTGGSYGNLCWLGKCCLCTTLFCVFLPLFPLPCIIPFAM